MSTPTPPGWYPVPGTGQERWWNGTAWTDDHRTAGQLNDAPTQGWDNSGLAAATRQPQPGPYPTGKSDGTGRRGNGLVVGVSAAVGAVLLAAVVVAVVLIRTDPPTPNPVPTLTATGNSPVTASPLASASPSRSATNAAPALTVADAVHGWRVPLPDGWTAERPSDQASVIEIAGQYSCSQSTSLCVRGQFSVAVDTAQAADAESAAEAEIAAYAPEVFGPLTSHRELATGAVTVAGVRGHAIRWYVQPGQGASGYVLVVALPAQSGGFVILHGGVDDDPKAPKPAELDRIVLGIAPAS
ncbi:DUF2510 domain-containing protein [Kitasatospora sp. NPDC049285]|uniref:DUF2510 domain-containing protein n=1 Tax=Kitasatospora sp. NPDC049285 TaxID=3157096 RepID=UPI00343ED92C